jgi:hypothetical protein
MPRVSSPSSAARYLAALAFSALALIIALALHAWLQVTPFQFFLTAVLLTAYYGGMRPALLATALGTLAINYFFETPLYSLQIIGVDTLVKLLVFLVAALLVSSVTERLRETEAGARAAQAEAEAARAQLHGILARISDGFFALDPEWRFTYASPQTAPIILSHRGSPAKGSSARPSGTSCPRTPASGWRHACARPWRPRNRSPSRSRIACRGAGSPTAPSPRPMDYPSIATTSPRRNARKRRCRPWCWPRKG